MQMVKQERMQAQAIGDIYKYVCVHARTRAHVCGGDWQVGIKSFTLVTFQTVHGLKVTCLWQTSSSSSLYQE